MAGQLGLTLIAATAARRATLVRGAHRHGNAGDERTGSGAAVGSRPATGILVLAGSVVLIASDVQAARIMAVLAAASRLRLLPGREARHVVAARGHHGLGSRRQSWSHSPKEE
ncbi:hypothetical protein [Streptomyces sp. NPDC005283]|uniref:hypothetical protein n=1 Tax=Streptomyces sp. NPDC005283 TaxID=3156871 RepID=UPI00345368DB